MVIMISIIGGLLLIALIVIVVLNSISKSSNSNNSSCSGDTCPLGIKVVFDYFKSIYIRRAFLFIIGTIFFF